MWSLFYITRVCRWIRVGFEKKVVIIKVEKIGIGKEIIVEIKTIKRTKDVRRRVEEEVVTLKEKVERVIFAKSINKIL